MAKAIIRRSVLTAAAGAGAGRHSRRQSSRWMFVAAATSTVLTPTISSAFSIHQRLGFRRTAHSCPHRQYASAKTPQEEQMTQDALAIVKEAIRAVDPWTAVQTHLQGNEAGLQIRSSTYSAHDYDQILLVAFGKASSAMAKAVVERVEQYMPELFIRGVVIVKDDHATQEELEALKRHNVEIQEASHPVPDERSVQGATKVVNMVRKHASERTLAICCISGGGSALCCAPKPPLTLQDLKDSNEALLASGMTIQQMNVIRKRLEIAKGGRLAAVAYPSTLLTLVLSDILGDPLDLIASGPTVPDSSTWMDAWKLVKSSDTLQSSLPPAVLHMLQQGANGELLEDDIPPHVFDKSETILVGNNRLSVMAAADEAKRRGYQPVVLSSRIEGEAKHVAGMYTAMAQHLSCQRHDDVPYAIASLPAAIIAGGETTVTLSGETGKGGRNQELALAAALQLQNLSLRDVVLASVGTDGTDGPTDAAGAVVDGGTIERLGGSAEQALHRHDAYTYFKRRDGTSDGPLIITGPTGTNVADVCVVLVQ